MKTEKLSFDQIAADVAVLAEHLRAGPPIEGLIAIARGGLIPAAMLARTLALPMTEVAVRTYNERTPGTPKLLRAPTVPEQGRGWAIVDDLVDRGITAQFVRALLPHARFVCLYAKPAGRSFSDRCVREYPQDLWLIFPWESGD